MRPLEGTIWSQDHLLLQGGWAKGTEKYELPFIRDLSKLHNLPSAEIPGAALLDSRGEEPPTLAVDLYACWPVCLHFEQSAMGKMTAVTVGSFQVFPGNVELDM